MDIRAVGACGILLSLVLASGCASAGVVEAPEVDEEGAGPSYSISNNGWTMTATQPTKNGSWIFGGVQLTRTSGPTVRPAGACLLSVYVNAAANPVTCNSVADCSSYPSSIPAGGYRYCAPFDASGPKFCMYRPGAQASYCTGTPATGLPIAPGTYGTPGAIWDSAWSVPMAPPAGLHYASWASLGCFAGCTATDPSVTAPYGYAGF
jgi:hypothetical protein